MENYLRVQVIDKVCRADWFWGDIDRDVASELLANRKHGSFLVRNSRATLGGNYTIVVKKNDVVRNIRIQQGITGKYGIIADKCLFLDVCELVQHFCDNPDDLHDHFPGIDLLYPVCKVPGNANSASMLLHMLVDTNKELMNVQNDYNWRVRRRKELLREIDQSKTTMASLGVVKSMFEEHVTTLQSVVSSHGVGLMRPAAEELCSRSDEIDEKSLSEQRAAIHGRLETVKRRLLLEQSMKLQREEDLHRVRQDIDEMKPQLAIKNQEMAQLRMHVEDKGMDKNYLDLLLKDENPINQSQYDDPACYDDDGACVTRHCLIYHNPDIDQYGFHQEFCIFCSVKELVKKHQTLSLKFYNKQLDVCLTYPLNYQNKGEAPPIPHRPRRNTFSPASQEKRSS